MSSKNESKNPPVFGITVVIVAIFLLIVMASAMLNKNANFTRQSGDPNGDAPRNRLQDGIDRTIHRTFGEVL